MAVCAQSLGVDWGICALFCKGGLYEKKKVEIKLNLLPQFEKQKLIDEMTEKMKTAINCFGAFMSCLFPDIDKGCDEHNGC